ncbi:elongation factor Ts [Candidatus Parcubacteria bacterium]|nr:MAG: elongation factor Ts [Candidatus Parcubacteria bacterium]
MAGDSLALIKELREATGASLGDIQEAIKNAAGDKAKAMQFLKAKGKSIAEKKSSRSAKEGIIEAYVHSNNKIGVLVELRCETDFVAKNNEFKKLARELALQIAATNPQFIKPEDIPEEFVLEEKRIFTEQNQGINKPKQILDEIIKGKLEKRWSEICLLKQAHIRNEDITIEELITEYVAKLGEKIEISRFIRYEI